MMFAKPTLLFAALQASLAAAGSAIVKNACTYDIWVWSVCSTTGSSSAIHVPAGSQYSEAFKNAAVSLKVSKTNQLTGGAQTQFEYSAVNGQLWYDISFVDCASAESADNCPGHADGLSMTSSNSACGTVHCAAGAYCPTQAYYCDTPMSKLGLQDPVFTCPGVSMNSMDLVMTTCADDGQKIKRSIAGRLLMDA
ncbi:hypothetical protein EK21DRAFT_110713 [Setomelanomma holmii]|uniref:Uncharacterized protein n=1 Tax=Setomelanomma holmii TaxID=210430 RepID=A0A9P4HDA4_9PLEO|nr:hypothetical protein EK21DRAFT_110713 [Setomelanomma holmii]